ncbi:hypothetical protein [Rhizobium rhizogenes]|uniref:hypothetical protein n=1 Tax=Rhizobium rhizogenes TaxID=359 RepID=UPI0024BD834A|nr:hypothetical protein [Rhizobium rhizogenes]MDJ1634555.1 hypothetical protein [Rhizobium rhizogenes]
MPEYISYTEALLRVETRLRVASPEKALIEAMVRRRIDFGYPNWQLGDDFFDLDNHPLRRMSKIDKERLVIVESASLNAWIKLVLNPPDETDGNVTPRAAPSRAGRKPEYDWEEYERVFQQRVAEIGLPDLQNEKGWRTQTDVKTFLLNLAEKDNAFPSDTTAKERAKEFIRRAGGN